ncbi:MAG TPA: hypothetical protein ENL06_02195 [Candidatus Portnoybacteria bacterium]|nr:hypothetical protein [Candidatus Portnoybacteria bacterium]
MATLTYYHLWGSTALSIVELYRYLIRINDLPKSISFKEFLDEVQKLIREGAILSKNGYIGLNKNDFISRQNNYKTSLLKKKKIRKYLKFFLWLPMVKGLAISGSLTMDNAREGSDWDILVLCQNGKIWLTRFWLAFLSQLIGKRRYANNIKDRFCWNLFLTDTLMPKNFQTWGNALMLSQSEVLFGQNEFLSFCQKNSQWMEEKIFDFNFRYRWNYIWLMDTNLIVKIERQIGRILKPFFYLLNNKLVKKLQVRRIEKNTQGKNISQRYLYLSDDLLIFHYPPSKSVLAEERTGENFEFRISNE